MPDAEIEQTDLDGWPTFSLESVDVRQVTGDEFRELVVHGGTDAHTYTMETASGGTVEARLINGLRRHKKASCRNFLRAYLGKISFSWEPEKLVLLNEPCYIATASGAVFLADGRIVLDTLFPTGQKDLAFRVGGGLTVENLADEISKASLSDDGVWAPLLSRGSTVYGHVIAESMVQDAALHWAGLSPLISYAATAWPQGAQQTAMALAHSPVVKFPAALVKVPRVVFASKLYRHLPLGTGFLRCIEGIKAAIPSPAASHRTSDKIYVSRLGVPNRRMTNETELIEQLSRMGFRIVAGEEMPFEDQVNTFRNARLIVGPYGSGLINAAFAATDATLCELRSLNNPDNSPNWDDFYLGLAATMHFSYGISVAENAPEADAWECNIPDVIDLIRTASAEAHGTPWQAIGGTSSSGEYDAIMIAADDLPKAPGFWAIPDHAGDDYYSILVRLHQCLQPKNYLEIGTNGGETLALASCPAIAIDPNLEIKQEVVGAKTACFLFRMKSDVFFSTYDPKTLLGDAVAMAFLQGRHFFEDVLRDFLQLEKSMAQHSIILIHDGIPTDAHVGRRLAGNHTFMGASNHADWWAGDVWKAVAALRRFRADLTIHAFSAFPTGLVAITNLNPSSQIIAERYDEIVEQYGTLDLAEYGVGKYLEELDVRDTGALADPESIFALFRV